MKILSWDVGIKNLAYCYLEKTLEQDNIKILDWGSIDLLQSKRYKCTCIITKTKKICGKNATYYLNDDYYCGTHKSQYKPIIDESYNEGLTINLCEFKHPITNNICNKRTNINKSGVNLCRIHLRKTIQDEKNRLALKPVKKLNSLKTDPQQLALLMFEKLENLNISNIEIDTVYIENQPALKNPIMKTVATFLFSYFVFKKINTVKFISATNKLKVDCKYLDDLLSRIKENHPVYILIKKLLYINLLKIDKKNCINNDNDNLFIERYGDILDELVKKIITSYVTDGILNKYEGINLDIMKIIKKESYDINKILSVDYTSVLLEKINSDQKWITYLNDKQKKDDICDSFLQGFYLLK
jgi:hypothetical protein